MTLEDRVEKLFIDNPDLSEEEAVKRLKEMKNPKTNKPMWKSGTIRNRIEVYLRKKRGGANIYLDASNKPPMETRGYESDLKTEGKEIEPHRPKDPFAIKSEEDIEKNADQIGKVDKIKESQTAAANEQWFNRQKGFIDDISKKILNQASMDAKPFKDEIISIISDLASEVREEFTNDRKEISDLKKEVSNIRTQGLTTYEPIVEYDDLNLKQSTIDAIHENTEEKELKEESDYIDSLIKNEKGYTSVSQAYHKLIDLAKEAKDGVQLTLFYRDGKLSYNKKPVGRFGNSPRKLIIMGIAIGIPIGIIIFSLYMLLTGTPPPPTIP